jgi:hypothetical protein
VGAGELGPSWNAVARELVRAVWPDAPPANVALAIAGVLRAPDRATAKRDLDEAGVPTLAPEVQAEVSAATAIDFDTADNDQPERVDDEPYFTEPEESKEDSTEPDETLAADAADVSDEAPDESGAGADSAGDGRGDTDDEPSGETTGSCPGVGGRGEPGASSKRQKQSLSSASRLRSYVVPPSADNGSSKAGQKQDGRISAVDAAGIMEVLRYERAQRRTPEDMNETNPANEGYDVRSFYEDGELARWIEVKSTAGQWDRMGVALSPPQFRFAQRDGAEQCWLYVVEFALDPERRRLWCIQDPAERVTDFMFDDGWKGLADPPGGCAAAGNVETT